MDLNDIVSVSINVKLKTFYIDCGKGIGYFRNLANYLSLTFYKVIRHLHIVNDYKVANGEETMLESYIHRALEENLRNQNVTMKYYNRKFIVEIVCIPEDHTYEFSYYRYYEYRICQIDLLNDMYIKIELICIRAEPGLKDKHKTLKQEHQVNRFDVDEWEKKASPHLLTKEKGDTSYHEVPLHPSSSPDAPLPRPASPQHLKESIEMPKPITTNNGVEAAIFSAQESTTICTFCVSEEIPIDNMFDDIEFQVVKKENQLLLAKNLELEKQFEEIEQTREQLLTAKDRELEKQLVDNEQIRGTNQHLTAQYKELETKFQEEKQVFIALEQKLAKEKELSSNLFNKLMQNELPTRQLPRTFVAQYMEHKDRIRLLILRFFYEVGYTVADIIAKYNFVYVQITLLHVQHISSLLTVSYLSEAVYLFLLLLYIFIVEITIFLYLLLLPVLLLPFGFEICLSITLIRMVRHGIIVYRDIRKFTKYWCDEFRHFTMRSNVLLSCTDECNRFDLDRYRLTVIELLESDSTKHHFLNFQNWDYVKNFVYRQYFNALLFQREVEFVADFVYNDIIPEKELFDVDRLTNPLTHFITDTYLPLVISFEKHMTNRTVRENLYDTMRVLASGTLKFFRPIDKTTWLYLITHPALMEFFVRVSKDNENDLSYPTTPIPEEDLNQDESPVLDQNSIPLQDNTCPKTFVQDDICFDSSNHNIPLTSDNRYVPYETPDFEEEEEEEEEEVNLV